MHFAQSVTSVGPVTGRNPGRVFGTPVPSATVATDHAVNATAKLVRTPKPVDDSSREQVSEPRGDEESGDDVGIIGEGKTKNLLQRLFQDRKCLPIEKRDCRNEKQQSGN